MFLLCGLFFAIAIYKQTKTVTEEYKREGTEFGPQRKKVFILSLWGS